jgi:GT2 family glycosyltransferase
LRPEDYYGLHDVNHYPGRELLIPAEVFYELGMFDARNFPQTIADYDFTYRAYKAGYKIYCNYDARVETYCDTQGGLEYREQKSWRNYYRHLFGIKGKGNLHRHIRFALKNCPRAYLMNFLVIGITRRVFGYLVEWGLEVFRVRRSANTNPS